jgi:hypothetical protein
MKTSNVPKGEEKPRGRSGTRKSATPANERQEESALVAEIVDALEQRGIPAGAWLVDIARIRYALQEADDMLRRMENAIIRDANSSPLDES